MSWRGKAGFRKGPRVCACVACALLLLALAGQASASQQPGQDPAPVPPPADSPAAPPVEEPADPESGSPSKAPEPDATAVFPSFAPRYRTLAEAGAFLAALSKAAPDLAHTFELGRTLDGRSVAGLEFGAPGATALRERPTIFLFGGLDGRSLAGAEAVLACTHGLLTDPAGLPAGVTFVVVPWVAADALSWVRDPGSERPARDGRNARPNDDDRDGLVDEDGPDDLDGDGLILDMLIEDPRGPWARAGDGRFLVPAEAGEGVRFVWTREGRDDDGDGLFNEDPLGGVVLDSNFPVNRRGPWDDPCAGAVAMSEPLTRALADLVLGRRAAVVMLFQGHHGSLAVPGGLDLDAEGGVLDVGPDSALFERVTEAFLAATGRAQPGLRTLRAARGQPTPGAALDWMHTVAGALSIEVAPWGPEVEGHREVGPRDAGFRGEHETAPRSLDDRALLGRTEAAWERWLDNTRGGLGFVDWQPVELDGGRKGWVGGWEPRTIQNPPEDSLPAALAGLANFTGELARSLPAIDVEVTHLERDGDLLRLRARVHNSGRLPSGLAREGAGLRLELELPSGAQLVAGASSVTLPRLFGGELSREVAWVLVAPPDSIVTLRAHADWAASAVREVRR